MFRPHIGDCKNPDCNRTHVPIVVRDGWCDKCHHERKQAKKKAAGKKTGKYTYANYRDWEALMKVLEEGLADGLGEYEMIKLIRERDISLVQSQRIVRTEVNIAANTGVKVSAESFNLVMQKEWISHQDMRTRGRLPEDRKDHYHMDGQVVNMDAKFIDPRSKEEVEHPSDPKASAAMVINCRCTFAPTPKRDKQGRLIKK